MLIIDTHGHDSVSHTAKRTICTNSPGMENAAQAQAHHMHTDMLSRAPPSSRVCRLLLHLQNGLQQLAQHRVRVHLLGRKPATVAG